MKEKMSKTELLTRMQDGWDSFQAFLRPLTVEQLTVPSDAAGWTAKDHIMHLAVWEHGVVALLNGQSRLDAMGIDQATWDSGNFDQINAVIQQRHKDMPLEEVIKELARTHQALVQKTESLSEADLYRPNVAINTFAGAPITDPVISRIIGNSYAHFEEHRPWIAAIIGTT